MTAQTKSLARRIGSALVVCAAGAWLLSVLAVVLVGRRDDRPVSDAIIVLGAAQYVGRPSPVLRARLDHAHALYRAGVAPLVVLTGGMGDGDTTTEAAVGRRYLIALAVPDSAILLEPAGRTTSESMRGAAALLRPGGAVVLVSDPFHALRARVLAWRNGLRAVSSPTRTSPIAREPAREWRYIAIEAVKVPVAALFPAW
jgi:uncharacterized SAM-binding protein YcdF (DUF218 family)